MNRKAVVFLSLVLMSLSCSMLKKGMAVEKPSQKFDGNGITFQYPLNWEIISPHDLNIYVTDFTYLAVLADKDKDMGTIVRIVIVQTEKSFNAFLEQEEGYYSEQSKTYSENKITVDGNQAVQIESTGTGSAEDRRTSLEIYFEHAGQIYYLTFVTYEKNYPIVKADFTTVINSFHIL
jgi:hypothetical protein